MSTQPGRPTSIINVNTAAGARAKHFRYRARTPILALDFGTTSVLVTTSTADRITAADVDFARQLAKQSANFALAVERMFRGLPNAHEMREVAR